MTGVSVDEGGTTHPRRIPIYLYADYEQFKRLSALAVHAEAFAYVWVKKAKQPALREQAAGRLVEAVTDYRNGIIVHPFASLVGEYGPRWVAMEHVIAAVRSDDAQAVKVELAVLDALDADSEVFGTAEGERP